MPYLILVDKPAGITSFKAVATVRRILGEKRIGHTGTLDPMATGVLPLLTGRASRLSSLMLETDKRYTATVRLGTVTDTLDITGTVLNTAKAEIDDGMLKNAINSFLGEYDQVPPMYSALKKDGVRLYDIARNGGEVERKARRVRIKEINLINRINKTDFVIDVLCSKGTYIRSLAKDIGDALGCGACLTELRRTYAAGFCVEECIPLEKFENNEKYLLSPELCVKHLKEISTSFAQCERFCHGGQLDLNRLKTDGDFTDGEKVRIKYGAEFLGIGVVNLAKNQVEIGCVITENH